MRREKPEKKKRKRSVWTGSRSKNNTAMVNHGCIISSISMVHNSTGILVQFSLDKNSIMNFGIGLTLREGDRAYYYEKLDSYFPGLKNRYIRKYGNSYELKVPDEERLYKLLTSYCTANNIEYSPDRLFKYLYTFKDKICGEEVSLF